MMKQVRLGAFAVALLVSMTMNAQVKIKGVAHGARNDEGDVLENMSTYLGWNAELQKAIFMVGYGIYAMDYDGLSSVSKPKKEPAVKKTDDPIWITNFNLMYGNSGAAYLDGQLITIFSRDESSTTDDELFVVRKWDANTGTLLSSEIFPKSANLECAGMSYNPVDGQVYGLFYLTGLDLPQEIVEDPDYYTDQDDDLTDGDAGYALCSVDPFTMEVTPITPGLYYDNFVTFAINSEGRAFAMTSGGASGYLDEDGKMRNADNELTGAQLYEFNLKTGLRYGKPVHHVDPVVDTEGNQQYDGDGNPMMTEWTEYLPTVPATGYSSQYRRQAACFAKSDPEIMYWIGYYNSGKGYNSWGSWSSLPDRDSATGETWRDNGKYDTALYEVNVTTGEAQRVAKIKDRMIFSALWIDGDDCSDGADIATAISDVKTASVAADGVYTLSGQYMGKNRPLRKGVYVERKADSVQKIQVR